MVTTYDVDVMFGDASAVDTGAREGRWRARKADMEYWDSLGGFRFVLMIR
mgnify:CR=1 FL=1